MSTLTRRTLLATAGGTALAAQLPVSLAEGGRIKPRASGEIKASAISVGFETLDRQFFDPRKAYGPLAASGVKWARCQTGWGRTEPRRGEYDFKWLDEVVDSLLAAGIQPWFSLSFGNKLYIPEAPHFTAVGWHPLGTPEAREGWLRFTRAAADRYRKRVRHWEIWNEPNLTQFWRPTAPNPDDYAQLVSITAPEIRKRVPGAVIVGGAYAGSNCTYLDDLDRSLAAGMARHVDRITYHPYRTVPEQNSERDYRALCALVARHKPAIKIWQGETGCPSEPGGMGALANSPWNEQRQAKWLLRRLLTDLRLGIELTSYFHTVDMVNYYTSDGKPTGKTNYKGVLRAGDQYTPKMSFHALQNLCALFDNDAAPADLLIYFSALASAQPVNMQAIQTAAFVRRGAPVYAWWYPEDLLNDFAPATVSFTLRHGGAAEMKQPVLVDLLTAKVYDVPAKQERQLWRFEKLPLTDYPLLITDKAALA